MASNDTEVLLEYVLTENEEDKTTHPEEELLNSVKAVYGDMTSNTTTEFSAFLNAITEDEIHEDKRIVDDSTFFRTSPTRSIRSSVSNNSNVSFSVIFQDQLDDDAESEFSEKNNVPNVKAKMDEDTSHKNLFQGRKCTKKSTLSKNNFLKEQDHSSKMHSDVKGSLEEHKMEDLFHSLHKQCSFSDSPLLGGELPRAAELLQMAVKAIKLLKEKEVEKMEEKKHVKKEQDMMLRKLIDLLNGNEASSGNNINSNVRSSSSLQEFDEYQRQDSNEMRSHNKFNFRGFRSRKPVYRDNIGRFTAERLFTPSPPPSPTPGEDPQEGSVRSEALHDLSELEFVFKPSGTTLAELNHRISVRKPPNGKRDAKKGHLDGRKRKATKRAIAQEERRGASKTTGQKKVAVSHLEGFKKKGKSRKSVNRVWATNLTRKKQKKGNCFAARQPVRSERRNLFTHDQASHVSKKQIQASRQLSSLSAKHSNRRANKVQSSQTKVKAVSDSDFSKSFPEGKSSPRLSSHDTGLTPKLELKTTSVESGVEITSPRSQIKSKKNASTQKSKRKGNINGKNQKRKSLLKDESYLEDENATKLSFSLLRPRSPNSINKEYLLSTSSTSQFHYSDKSNWHKCESFKKLSGDDGMLETQIGTHKSQSQECAKFFYPVHPYTSPDLPVHFIPIDPENIPDYFPLYCPTFGIKNTPNVFPSFVKVRRPGVLSSRPKYTLTNGIQSSRLPHQTLPAKDVLPRILPGILSTSASPLVPDIKPDKTAAGDPVPVKNALGNSHPKSSSKKTAVVGQSLLMNDVLKTHNNTQPVEDLSTPPITLSWRPVNAHPKIHKCTKCSFESPKLGVLKRHQLSHSRTSSYPLVPNDEVLIIDSRKENTFGSNQPGRPSLINNGMRDQNAQPLRSPSPGLLADTDDPGIKIVSTESLKESFAVQDPFHGFSGPSGNSIFEKRFPSITITPVIDLKE